MWWLAVRRLRRGKRVRFRAYGPSMTPIIHSGQRVEVWPANPERVESGDVVVADVGETTCLHRVSRVDRAAGRFEIADASGEINGWTGPDGILGICVAIDGEPVAGATAKVSGR